MNDLSKAGCGKAQIITEVHGRLRREITQDAYQRDLRYAEDLCLPAHEWSGTDRDGRPMAIAWVCTTNGRVLSAYEITGRA
jgi:hypothetical protein